MVDVVLKLFGERQQKVSEFNIVLLLILLLRKSTAYNIPPKEHSRNFSIYPEGTFPEFSWQAICEETIYQNDAII